MTEKNSETSNPYTNFTLRILKSTLEKVHSASEYRAESATAFMNRAVLKELAALGFLSHEHMQALGVA